MPQLAPHKRSFLLLFTTLTALMGFYRLVFYLVFRDAAVSVSSQEVIEAILVGLRFDARVSLLICLPVLLLGHIKTLSWTHSPFKERLWIILYITLLFLLNVIYAGDLGYYEYLQSRINFRIFEFFKNIDISVGMVLQTYNVTFWIFAFVLFSWLSSLFLKSFIFNINKNALSLHNTKNTNTSISFRRRLLNNFIWILGVTSIYHSSLTQYPLRWSDAFFSQNLFLSHLALNPIHYIFDSAENAKADYNIEAVKEFYPVVAKYLGVDTSHTQTISSAAPAPTKPNFARGIEPSAHFLINNPTSPPPNIVYIVMESMVAYKTGIFNNPAKASPNLDELAQKSLFFKHFYTPTEGTARSMFCLLTGIPDINAKSTSTRNPLIINQHTLINALSDYDKFYFIGGNAAWGNIRGVLMNNVDNLKMFEGDFSNGPRTDVWGLSDYHLFKEANKQLSENYKAQKKPFFALIQSASYHRPYTIPKDRGSFTEVTLSPEELSRYGFASNEEYNSFRFSDYSLGEFIKDMQNEPFFKNTIFVIHGDHGLPHHNAEHLSKGYKHFNLNRFHTPLLIYSSLLKKPQTINTMTIEPDVLPTLLGLMNINYPYQALGRNVLALKPSDNRYAFSYVYYDSPLTVMLYDQEYLAFGNEYEIKSLHKYNSETPDLDIQLQEQNRFHEMKNLLKGLFETSKFMLHHNQKIGKTSPSASTK